MPRLEGGHVCCSFPPQGHGPAGLIRAQGLWDSLSSLSADCLYGVEPRCHCEKACDIAHMRISNRMVYV
jgi:hypothetical protein